MERMFYGEDIGEAQRLAGLLLAKGYTEAVAEDTCLSHGLEAGGVKVSLGDVGAGIILRSRMESIAVEEGYVSSAQELGGLLQRAYVELARRIIRNALSRRDLMVSQAVQALDDLDETFNLFTNRVKEWYGYHFPELTRLVSDASLYMRLVLSIGGRSTFTAPNITRLGIGKEEADQLAAAASSSIGTDLRREDLEAVSELAAAALSLYEARRRIERYLETVMAEVAPNLLELVGPSLGARLIAAAGGLESLARKSASTIQVLGAEKALFRSIRTGSRPPKHGLIFQHKDIHQAPRWQRGKIARALAAKIAIAVRLDSYGGEQRGRELLNGFEERVKEIREKYPQPTLGGKQSGRG
jgi:nucleolar protein 56